MLWAAHGGRLELRSDGGATRLRASFPYGQETELAPGRREVIAARAFADRIEQGGDIHLLLGHDYNHPLASRAAGSLTVTDTDAGLDVEAEIDTGTTWARDFLAAHSAGLVRGLSPGFRVLPDGERIERRGGVYLRTVKRAALFEISAVTRPAYPQAQIEARCWSGRAEAHDAGLQRSLSRWRA